MTAKFNLLVAASIPAIAIVPLLACGGSSSKPDSGIIVHDSGSNGSGSNVVCAYPTTYNPTVSQTFANYTAQGSGSVFSKIDSQMELGGSGATVKVLRVAIFAGCGTNGGNCGSAADATPDWPTVFAPKLNIDVGSACSSAGGYCDMFTELLTDVDGSGFFQTYYLGVSGTLNITAASDGSNKTFAGNINNAEYDHVDFSGNNIVADPDGCISTLGSANWTGSTRLGFDGKVVVQQAGGPRDEAIRNYLRHRTM